MKKAFQLSKTNKILGKIAVSLGASFLCTKLTTNIKLCSFESSMLLQQERDMLRIQQVEENIGTMKKIDLGTVDEYKEDEIYTHRIQQDSGTHDFIIVKHKGEFYALGAISTYNQDCHLA